MDKGDGMAERMEEIGQRERGLVHGRPPGAWLDGYSDSHDELVEDRRGALDGSVLTVTAVTAVTAVATVTAVLSVVVWRMSDHCARTAGS